MKLNELIKICTNDRNNNFEFFVLTIRKFDDSVYKGYYTEVSRGFNYEQFSKLDIDIDVITLRPNLKYDSRTKELENRLDVVVGINSANLNRPGSYIDIHELNFDILKLKKYLSVFGPNGKNEIKYFIIKRINGDKKYISVYSDDNAIMTYLGTDLAHATITTIKAIREICIEDEVEPPCCLVLDVDDSNKDQINQDLKAWNIVNHLDGYNLYLSNIIQDSMIE